MPPALAPRPGRRAQTRRRSTRPPSIPTCKACDDFYQYATGGWRKKATIPAGHASWGSFDELAQHNREALHAILDDAAKNTTAPAGSDTQKLGTFYRACMDEAAIEKAGIGADRTAAAERRRASTSVPSLATEIAWLQTKGVNDGLDFSSEPDTKDSSKTIASVGLGGLGLPDRDYYLNDDEHMKTIRAAYHDYVTTQLQNLGDDAPTAAKEADAIVALETTLAKATPTRVELRDPKATYHPTAVAALPAMGSHIPWSSFFAQFDAPKFATIDMNVPAFVTAYDAQLAATPLPVWKTLPALPRRRLVRERAAQTLRRRRLPLPQHGAVRREGTAPALAALHLGGRRRAAHAAGQGLRDDQLPAGREGARQRAGRQPAVGAARRHRHARLDGAANQSARRRASSPRSPRRSAIPTPGSTTRR